MAETFISVDVLGDKELQRALDKLDKAVQKKVMRKVLRESFAPVLPLVKARTPVLEGKLRKSLKLRAARGKRGQFGVEIRTGTRAELGIAENDPSYYPMSVEYGHAGPRPAPAHPYMRNTLDANRSPVLERVKGNLWRRIRDEAVRLAPPGAASE